MTLRQEATAAHMLHDLHEAHAQVRACLDEMAALTSKRAADRTEYTAARFRISKASMARRACFNAVCANLGDFTSEHSAVIDKLVRLDRELSSKSTSHVKKWTAETIYTDWPGYCAASRRIRERMAAELEAEEAMLFPLLRHRSRENGAVAPSQAAHRKLQMTRAGPEMRLT